MMNRRRTGVAVTMLAAALAALTITPAAAEPATTVSYPTSASATRLTGYAFDACSAPPLADHADLETASPYRGVGVYIGGVSRSCAQPNLTAAWVTAASLQGWRIIPIYVGYQAPCTHRPNATKFTDITAATLGTADAADAVLQAQALGMLPGSAIYGDMEHYSRDRRGVPYGGAELCLRMDQGAAPSGLPRWDVRQPVLGCQTLLGGVHRTRLRSPGRAVDGALGRHCDADRLGWHPQCALVQSSAWEAVPRRP